MDTVFGIRWLVETPTVSFSTHSLAGRQHLKEDTVLSRYVYVGRAGGRYGDDQWRVP